MPPTKVTLTFRCPYPTCDWPDCQFGSFDQIHAHSGCAAAIVEAKRSLLVEVVPLGRGVLPERLGLTLREPESAPQLYVQHPERCPALFGTPCRDGGRGICPICGHPVQPLPGNASDTPSLSAPLPDDVRRAILARIDGGTKP